MAEGKHTAGPWIIIDRQFDESDGSVYPRHIIGGARGLEICRLESDYAASQAANNPDGVMASDHIVEAAGDIRSRMANALLIAAAPELLEAVALSTADMTIAADLAEKQGLHTVASFLRSRCDFNRPLIAKATGTTP